MRRSRRGCKKEGAEHLNGAGVDEQGWGAGFPGRALRWVGLLQRMGGLVAPLVKGGQWFIELVL